MYTHQLVRLRKFKFLSVTVFKHTGNFVLNYATYLLMAVPGAI